MRLNSKAFELIVCPVCRAQLVNNGTDIWNCENSHEFSEENGALILRADVESHSVFPQGGDGSFDVEKFLTSDGFVGFLKRLIGINYVPYGCSFEEYIKSDDLVLNLGSGVTKNKFPYMVSLDYFLFPDIDIVADAHYIPFADNSFDVVLSEFMLEHVRNPFRICAEIERVLKPGGILYISYPFIHPYHAYPGDYFRFTHQGLLTMFEGMEIIREGPLTGPACRWVGATADIFTFWIKMLRVRIVMRAFVLTLLSPLKFLDLIFNKHPESKFHAVTLFSVLRKRRER